MKVRELHDHGTQNISKLHIRQPKNENGIQMTKDQGSYFWNKLPEAVTKTSSLLTCKEKLKNHYLKLQHV